MEKIKDFFTQETYNFYLSEKTNLQNKLFTSLLNLQKEKRIIFIFNSDFDENKKLIDELKKEYKFDGFNSFNDSNDEKLGAIEKIKNNSNRIFDFLNSDEEYIIFGPSYLLMLFYLFDSVSFESFSQIKDKLKIIIFVEKNQNTSFFSLEKIIANEFDLNQTILFDNSTINSSLNSLFRNRIDNISLFDLFYIVRYTNKEDIILYTKYFYIDDFSHFFNEGVYLMSDVILNEFTSSKSKSAKLASTLNSIKEENNFTVKNELVKDSGLFSNLEGVLES